MELGTESGNSERSFTLAIARRACDKLFKFPEAVRLDDPDLEGAIELLALKETLEQTVVFEIDQLENLKTKAKKDSDSWDSVDISLYSTEVQCATTSLVGARGSLAQIDMALATNHGVRNASKYLKRIVNESILEIKETSGSDSLFDYSESEIYIELEQLMSDRIR